ILSTVVTTVPFELRAQDPPANPPTPVEAQPNMHPSDEPVEAPLSATLPPSTSPPQSNSSGTLDPSYTQGPFANLFSPIVGMMRPRVDYRASWFPDETVSGQGTQLGYVEQSFSASIPLWQSSTDEFSGSAGVRNELFHTGGTILPDSKMPFPGDLWNIRLGLGYRHLFDN